MCINHLQVVLCEHPSTGACDVSTHVCATVTLGTLVCDARTHERDASPNECDATTRLCDVCTHICDVSTHLFKATARLQAWP